MISSVPMTALRGTSQSAYDKLAQGLGYFSIGLGLAELLAPQALCRMVGLQGHETLVRAYGAREVAAGVAILTSHDPTPWIWARVAGDAVDLATLATAGAQGNGGKRGNAGMALAAVAGVTALDLVCAWGLGAEKGGRGTATADYGDRSGFPRPPQAMRGAARDFEVPKDMRVPDLLRPDLFEARQSSRAAGRTPSTSNLRLRIKTSDMGRIVVIDDPNGHEFAFRIETSRGRQSLEAFAPKWAGGREPVSITHYVIEARQLAEREATDRGWLGL